jgi:hypothetical protein
VVRLLGLSLLPVVRDVAAAAIDGTDAALGAAVVAAIASEAAVLMRPASDAAGDELSAALSALADAAFSVTDDRGADLFDALRSGRPAEEEDQLPADSDVADAAAAEDAEDFELERVVETAADAEWKALQAEGAVFDEAADTPAAPATLGAVLAAIDEGQSQGSLSVGDAAYLRRCAIDGCASRAAVVEAFTAEAAAAGVVTDTVDAVSKWLAHPQVDLAEAMLGEVATLCPRYYAAAEALLSDAETGVGDALTAALTDAFHAAVLAHDIVNAAFEAFLVTAPPLLGDGAEQPEPDEYRRSAVCG